MATIADVPPFDAFMLPIVERLKVHGRSMTIQEMVDDVSAAMGLSEEVRPSPMASGRSWRSSTAWPGRAAI